MRGKARPKKGHTVPWPELSKKRKVGWVLAVFIALCFLADKAL